MRVQPQALGIDYGCTHARYCLGPINDETRISKQGVFDIRQDFPEGSSAEDVFTGILGAIPTRLSGNIFTLAIRAAGPVTDNDTLVDLRNIRQVIDKGEAGDIFGVNTTDGSGTVGNDLEAVTAANIYAAAQKYLPIPWASKVKKGTGRYPAWNLTSFHTVAHGTGMGTLDTSIRRLDEAGEQIEVTMRRSEEQHDVMSASSDHMLAMLPFIGKVQRLEAEALPDMTESRGIAGASWEWIAAGGGLGGVVRLFLAESLKSKSMDEESVLKFMRGDFSGIKDDDFRRALEHVHSSEGEYLTAVVTEFAGIFKKNIRTGETQKRYNKSDGKTIPECVEANDDLMEIWGGYAGGRSLKRPVLMSGGTLRYYHDQIGDSAGRFKKAYLDQRSSARNNHAVAQVPLLRTRIGGNTAYGAMLIAKGQQPDNKNAAATFRVELNEHERTITADGRSLRKKLGESTLAKSDVKAPKRKAAAPIGRGSASAVTR